MADNSSYHNILEHTATLTPEQEHSEKGANVNAQAKQVKLCEALGGEAEVAAAKKHFTHIQDGGDDLVTPVGKSCGHHPTT